MWCMVCGHEIRPRGDYYKFLVWFYHVWCWRHKGKETVLKSIACEHGFTTPGLCDKCEIERLRAELKACYVKLAWIRSALEQPFVSEHGEGDGYG